ncbi:MAG: hypothetical protein QM679_06275 [Patulibacter sp.]
MPGRGPLISGWDPQQTDLATGASHLGALRAVSETERSGRAATELATALAEPGRVIAWVDRATLYGAVPVELPEGVAASFPARRCRWRRSSR